jgi:tetratricopeptide (TPR) repeat protein
VEGARKTIVAGRREIYDVVADPGETQDLAAGETSSPALLKVLSDYPTPAPDAAPPSVLTDEARRRLASLGYLSASAPPVIRRDAPRPADMTNLFGVLEDASALFVTGQYARAIPLFERVLEKDRHNVDAELRLATAHSSLGHDAQAIAAFDRATRLAPRSKDIPIYRALHEARGRDWARALPVLERAAAEQPNRLPVIEALAHLREKESRIGDAIVLWQRVLALRTGTAAELSHLGQMAMGVQRSDVAIDAFERARALSGWAFSHELELGVLYLSERRFEDARAALDRVAPTHPDYAMALFKRAQVSVLLKEPDRLARIDRARQHADATTRDLIARERLFQSP